MFIKCFSEHETTLVFTTILSNKLYDFYAISNLYNFAKWSRLVWLSQNSREGTSLFETFVLFRWETSTWGYSGHHLFMNF